MTFLQYWLKIKWLDMIQTKKAEKSSCFLQFTQCVFNLENYKDSLRRCWRYHYCLFLKILFFLCGATSQPRIKRTSQSIGTKVSLIILFFPFRHQSTLCLFLLHLWQRYSFFVLCILLLIFVTINNVERDINSFWEDDINPFTRKNETKCVKIIPRFSVYVPIHN